MAGLVAYHEGEWPDPRDAVGPARRTEQPECQARVLAMCLGVSLFCLCCLEPP